MEARGNIEKFKNRGNGIERHRAKSRNTFLVDALIFYRHFPRTQLSFDVHCQIRDNGGEEKENEDAKQYIYMRW